MSNKETSRFVGRIKMYKKQEFIADEDLGIIPTIEIKEVSVPGIGSYLVQENNKRHASTDITFVSDPTLKYQHRGSLVSVINYYKVILKHGLRVKYIIEREGWGSLLTMELGETSYSLGDYLVERFWDTTNTFHFHFSENALSGDVATSDNEQKWPRSSLECKEEDY
ncbi:hypothetical protein MKW98_003524 [Papaver atlanticum]|uniref:Uncharacterized protein n=1 Tax=Papaver atlanticum TaxID=357466 RepID=A0AAD4XRP8_9MAGN|nr:hypothetical protein MKW98_003524 [Papaver atlanticum]